MKVGIDISQIVYAGSGVSRYLNGLVGSILKYDTGNDWIFFFSSMRQKLSSEIVQQINNKGFTLKKYPFPPTLLSWVWNRWHFFNLELFMKDLDWFISSDWVEPPAVKTKKATIIHDLAFFHYPETVHWKILKNQQQRLTHVCQESNLILADSSSTKKDIEHFLTLQKAKVRTLYPGVEVSFPNKETVGRTLKKHHLDKNQFILTVAKLEPRKNLERLIKAHQELNNPSLPLVIVGPKGWGSLKLKAENVFLLGYLNDAELYSLYQSCLFFVYPSLYEGFGYPLIEAASFGTAIATANTSSLKELGQGISLQFNPKETADIAAKLKELTANKELRVSLGQKAAQKALDYNWQNTYQKLISYLQNN